MTNGFDDLDEAVSDQDDQETEDYTEEIMPETTPDTTTDTESTLDHPAFPYDDASQEAIYPTADTWAEFEDTLDFEVKRQLRDWGIRDIPKREYHEALLQLAIENPERLAELVRDGRK